ncbi:2-oxoglutarate dehydrogenase complex dihydrolipoyllysine-residue succinyltransferase [Fodinicurvata sp. EGI_FJ10296]|uniref:2-oxoglutarate dehydrogenase complex dihydrolipoyllysine-residue succinyltransferase n=1 Tax=Fodinicurvata sp. EGI_FJ10296 TaxID=3231908 RepID=UPI003451CA20
MSTDIVVPALGESVTEATIAKWLKKPGDKVDRDEAVVELETDKVTLEVNASEAGVLEDIVVSEGETVEVGAKLGSIGAGSGAAASSKEAASSDTRAAETKSAETSGSEKGGSTAQLAADASQGSDDDTAVMPAARKMIADNKLDVGKIAGTGKDGRITKQDVQDHLDGKGGAAKPSGGKAEAKRDSGGTMTIDIPAFERPATTDRPKKDREERVRMSKLRQTIARRLKEAQDTAAMLTTFNEVDMTAMKEVREAYKAGFEKKHGVRLGFMSFFIKACVQVLQELPAVNAEVDGTDIVYKNYYDIGVAVGTPQGLVVPVVRDCDRLSFAEVEQTINGYGKKARDGKLSMADLTGGTFTISNGGVYGSLMSTPILNPPQSAILGMHKIQDRPMAINGKVEIRPMMYLALSYDHRIVDGKEAVTFLVRVKEYLEDPQRLLLEV